MTAGQPIRQQGFLQIGLKGNFKKMLIVGIVILLIGIGIFSGLQSLHPQSKMGDGKNVLLTIIVTAYTKDPVHLLFTHDFIIHPTGMFFYVVGVDPVVFNITITQVGGTYSFHDNRQLTVPNTLTTSSSSEFTHHEELTIEATLSPGMYNIEIQSNDKVHCEARQDFKYADLQTFTMIIGIIGGGVIGLWFYMVMKVMETNRIATTRQMNQAAAARYYSQGYPQYSYNIYANDGVQAVPSQPVYPSYGQPPAYGQTMYGPGQSEATQSNLAYRAGSIYTELVCNNCMQIVRSQPVDGIVTCEHCGDKARVF